MKHHNPKNADKTPPDVVDLIAAPLIVGGPEIGRPAFRFMDHGGARHHEAVEFLERLRPGGPWVLTAIIPDGVTKTVTVGSHDEVFKFVRDNDGKRNVYFSVNPTRTKLSKKATKADIAEVAFLLADLDPEEDETPQAAKARYLTAIAEYPIPCTAIIDSGNGVQALYKLVKPIKLAKPIRDKYPPEVSDVEARSKALMEALGAKAGTQNIDRILRLPGTTNIPNAKKLKAGRVACPTRLIQFSSATCRLEDFPALDDSDQQQSKAGADKGNKTDQIDWTKVAAHAGWLRGVSDLPSDFRPKGRMIVAHQGNLKFLNDDLIEAGLIARPYESWNAVCFALAGVFKADGRFTSAQIAAALLCPLDCNRHILKERDEARRRRAVERCLTRSHDPNPAVQTVQTMPWRERKVNGTPLASLHNVRLGIVAMGIHCSHDLFRDVTIIGYRGDVYEIKPLVGELTNAALLQLRLKFDQRFGFDPEDRFIHDAVKTLAFENCFDPILDMLTEAEANWDGVERLDTWVVDYFLCEGTELNCAIGRKVLIAAVERARNPGCKFDNITVLESEEGMNKSTAIRVLAGDPYFSDQSILGARDKEVQEQLAGVWMHECADLTGLKKAEIEHVKAFASRQVDRARPAYGRVVEKVARRSIEFATTNDTVYLQSQTGNRRFWPLPVGNIDIEALRRDRLQLLGEAAKCQSAGEGVVLEERLWPDAKIEQERRRVRDPWEDVLANMPEFVDEHVDFGTGASASVQIVHRIADIDGDEFEEVSSFDLLTHVLKIPPGQQQKFHSMKLAEVMKRLGWERPQSQKVTIDGKQVRGYQRRVGGSS